MRNDCGQKSLEWERQFSGAGGRWLGRAFEGLSLRLYNPQTHQWSLNFAAINSGAMSPATIGGFKNGRGEFYNQENTERPSHLLFDL
jgi:hypothetical protein